MRETVSKRATPRTKEKMFFNYYFVDFCLSAFFLVTIMILKECRFGTVFLFYVEIILFAVLVINAKMHV